MTNCRKETLLVLLIFISHIFVFSQVRQNIPILKNWQFHKGDVALNDLKNVTWEKISIPHTWNKEDGLGGTDRKYYRGTGVYINTIDLPAKIVENKRIFLRFEAVSSSASVFLNGIYVGKHDGAFSAFCFDITSFVNSGKNTLMVKATNIWNENIIPLAGDFTVWGGIYRDVSLLITDPICITPLDYASSGLYVTQTEVNQDRAILDVKTKVANSCIKETVVQVRINLFDANENLVASTQKEVALPKDSTIDVCQRLTVLNPTLWEGRPNANLYVVKAEIKQEDQLVDGISENIGLRYFHIDPEKGFFLNGKKQDIHGVNRHQDRENKGWAISKKDHDVDMCLIKEMGANAIRMAHYPQSAYFYSLCDKNGILAWTEIPFIERATYTNAFLQNLKQQAIEMIRQNYNHPSIFCWGLFNELTKGEPQEIVMELNNLMHKEDPTRFTTCAPNMERRKENDVTDYLAYNTYPGWYWADPDAMGGSLVHWNSLHGNKGICVSEYGAGASIHQHEQGLLHAPKTDGAWHPEEWQAIVHELNYKHIKKNSFVWGSFIWNMFDFGVASRNEGDKPGINDKGLVTYDRKVKKDAFYYYKANWSDEPVLYITSRRFIKRSSSLTDIKVYTNVLDVHLYVNGKDYGVAQSENGVIIWKNISLTFGKNSILVSGSKGNVLLSDKCIWILSL